MTPPPITLAAALQSAVCTLCGLTWLPVLRATGVGAAAIPRPPSARRRLGGRLNGDAAGVGCRGSGGSVRRLRPPWVDGAGRPVCRRTRCRFARRRGRPSPEKADTAAAESENG